MMIDSTRDSLHDASENSQIFCERCQRWHAKYFTKQDHDAIMADAARKLSDAIDQIALEAFNKVSR